MTKKPVKRPKELTKKDYVFPKNLDNEWINKFMEMDNKTREKAIRIFGVKLKKDIKPVPKVKYETDGSVTIAYLTDGCGAPRKLNIHGYRTGSSGSSAVSLAILDMDHKTLAHVILHPGDVINESGHSEITPLFEQLISLMA